MLPAHEPQLHSARGGLEPVRNRPARGSRDAQGAAAEAVRLLQEAVDQDGPSVHLLDRLGYAHERSGDSAPAVRAWARASELGIGPSVKNLHYRLGEHYQKAGNAAYAGSRIPRRAHLAAGHELFWAGNPRDAQGAFEKATELEPTLTAAWFYLGETNRVLGHVEEARKAYTRCLARDPDHGRAIAGRELLPRP